VENAWKLRGECGTRIAWEMEANAERSQGYTGIPLVSARKDETAVKRFFSFSSSVSLEVLENAWTLRGGCGTRIAWVMDCRILYEHLRNRGYPVKAINATCKRFLSFSNSVSLEAPAGGMRYENRVGDGPCVQRGCRCRCERGRGEREREKWNAVLYIYIYIYILRGEAPAGGMRYENRVGDGPCVQRGCRWAVFLMQVGVGVGERER
jgi:hypothetical protein